MSSGVERVSEILLTLPETSSAREIAEGSSRRPGSASKEASVKANIWVKELATVSRMERSMLFWLVPSVLADPAPRMIWGFPYSDASGST